MNYALLIARQSTPSPSDASYLARIDAREAGDDVFKKLLHNGIAVSDSHEFGCPSWIGFNSTYPEDQLKNSTNIIFCLFGNIK